MEKYECKKEESREKREKVEHLILSLNLVVYLLTIKMPYYDLASELILIYSTTTKWIEENCDKKKL